MKVLIYVIASARSYAQALKRMDLVMIHPVRVAHPDQVNKIVSEGLVAPFLRCGELGSQELAVVAELAEIGVRPPDFDHWLSAFYRAHN